jgi:hypothetical protein
VPIVARVRKDYILSFTFLPTLSSLKATLLLYDGGLVRHDSSLIGCDGFLFSFSYCYCSNQGTDRSSNCSPFTRVAAYGSDTSTDTGPYPSSNQRSADRGLC